MQNHDKTITRTGSADETKRAGALLAECLQPGDIVLLSGDLGAGKTHFVQGVARGLGAAEVPISPTFNIVLTYESGRLPLHHFDLYRLEKESQLEDIGLREYLEAGGVCFLEWAEKFPHLFDSCLALSLSKVSDSERVLSGSAFGERAEELLSQWQGALGRPGSLVGAGGEQEGVKFSCNTDNGSDCSRENSPKTCSPPAPTSEPYMFSERLDKSDSSQVGAGQFVLAFDTANEVVSVGVGELDPAKRLVRAVACREVAAHRASNTTLLPVIDEMLSGLGVSRSRIACVCVGRGPGSFTGVRIAMATAKGVASALGVGLVGVSSLDAVAWNAWANGVRGNLLVVADAMRKEVYPVRFALFDDGVRRLSADRVVKAEALAEQLSSEGARVGECDAGSAADLLIGGDGLVKYRDLFEPFGSVVSDKLWEVSGEGLLLALQDAWRADEADPFDKERHNPAFALPVYTRLSDAEENERIKLAADSPKNLTSGVQDVAPDGGKGRATMHAAASLVAVPDAAGISYRPMAAHDAPAVSALEHETMGTDAWSEKLVSEELGQRNRCWWVAESSGELVGYAGALVVDGDAQILKVATSGQMRRCGIARELLAHVAEDARNLGAETFSLEVRASNEGAQEFYRAMGLHSEGVRPRYYSDREDAVIMKGPLPAASHDVAGMELKHLEGGPAERPGAPLILAIESSCDETAAAIVDGEGALLSDVVASQIDFHARFGGVVPEIASRKHIEAICGVCDEALESACEGGLAWSDLDAVAVTYAPGLLGALVVGVAFAKGTAWALDVPLICVNHLEGHLYANKIDAPDFQPPAVVSLVSGGNTMLVHMRDWGDYETLGATIDDAVGEAFDKVAKALGLGYPGGPVISREAAKGDPAAIEFPRAMLHSHDLRFSLSGLKTAVVNYINGERQAGRELNVPDICASFQQAVVDVQVAKAKTALQQTGARTFCLGGGVAANPALRAAYEDLCAKMNVRLVMPPLSSCGDNAGMIALVALDRYRQEKFAPLNADAQAHADLDEPY